jgi:hypothetical protein
MTLKGLSMLNTPIPASEMGHLAVRRRGFDLVPCHVFSRLRQTAPPLFWGGLSMLLASFVTLLLPLVDTRELQGVSVWLKPWKFQLSSGVYFLTLGLFMVWLPPAALRTRSVRYVVWAALLSGLFEVVYISWQGARGEASHFNVSTPLYGAMYSLMGVGAVVLSSTAGVLGIVISRSAGYGLPPVLKLSIVLGLWGTFVLGTGFGGYLGGQQAGHWVGGALSDAGGLPFVKWSRSGGDLRVAHFFGIHAMHFIPAFAWVLALLHTAQKQAVRAVWGFSVLFAAWCVWTLVQAVRGQPFWG